MIELKEQFEKLLNEKASSQKVNQNTKTAIMFVLLIERRTA